uniref:Ribosomal protein lateral stalk subunit P0 n=1 Tax=Rhinolophus ferrumequinum TaxID=59479 RepID=A0A671F6J3_RHIFE
MAASTTRKCLTSQRKLCIPASWRVSAMLPACVCRLVIQLLHQYPIRSSMDTSGCWLCLWRLITPSHLLKRSRPSWLIPLHLWLLPLWPLPPLPLLLLLPPQPRLKQRKSRRSRTRIWDLVSLTNAQKATNTANFICETRKIKAYFS